MISTDYRIERFDSLESTNTYTIQKAKEGEAEGLVVVADFQTKGRGQQGRVWESSAGENLLFSVLLRPPVKVMGCIVLTRMVCDSVFKTLKDYEIQADIKEPNDLLVEGKKICGILTESSSNAQADIEYAVVGIGLNVNAQADHLLETATSMQLILGKQLSRDEVMQKILTYLKEDTYELYAHAS